MENLWQPDKPATTPGTWVPPVSTRNAPHLDSHTRRHAGTSFHHHTDLYHDVRPSYPRDILDLLPTGPARILDCGAGTGKLTELLLDHAPTQQWQILASDPSLDMLRVLHDLFAGDPNCRGVWAASAEHTALPDHSLDAVVMAQAWHWVDVAAASAEFDRILRPTGRILLVWNTLDVRIPWVHRLTRIGHLGDVLRPDFTPTVAHPWDITGELRTEWVQQLAAEQLIDLAKTRAYWQRNPGARQRVETNLNWYLFEHLELEKGQVVDLPYRCDAFVLQRSTSGRGAPAL